MLMDLSNFVSSQYFRIFNAYRRAGVDHDVQLITDPIVSNTNEHVIVVGKGRMFVMPVKSEGEWHSANRMAEEIRAIQVVMKGFLTLL
jgi:hypothetical protein